VASKDLVVRLLGDASGLNKALGQVGNDAAHIGRTLTKTITPAAAAVGLALTKIGSDFNDARDAIIVGTGASGEALEGLIDSAKKVGSQVPNSFGDVGKAIADFNTRLGLTGTELEEAAKQALNLSRITKTDVETNVRTVTRVMQDWGVESSKASATMDLLFKASQLTGIGFQRLGDLMVQFGAPLRQLGFSMEETAALFAAFEQQGVNTETVMAGLRRALSTMAQAGEEPVEVFRRVVQSIKDAGSAGEANVLALELFGARAGPDMAAAIREGRFEIDQLVGQLDDTEGSIQQAADGTLRLSDRFAILRNRITAVLGPFGEIGGAIAGGVASIGPLIFGFSTLVPLLAKVRQGFQLLTAAILSNPIGAIATVLVSVAAAFLLTRNRANDASDAVQGFVDVLKNGMSPQDLMVQQLQQLVLSNSDVARAFKDSGISITEYAAAMLNSRDDAAIDHQFALRDSLREAADAFLDSRSAQLEFAKTVDGTVVEVVTATKALGMLNSITDESGAATNQLAADMANAGISVEQFGEATSAAAQAAQDALTREFGKIEAAAQSLARETEAAASAAVGSFLKLSDEGKKNVNTFVDETINGAMRLAGFQNNVTKIAGQTSGDFANYLMAMGLDAEDLVSDLADPAKTADLQRAYDAWTAATEVAQKDMSEEFAKVDPAFKKTLDGVAGLTESELKAIAKIAQREGEAVGRDMLDGMNAGVIAQSGPLAREVREAVRRAIEAGKNAARATSPSKETRDQIGIPLAEGIAAGITEGSPQIDQAMQAAVDQAIVPVAAQPAGQLVGAGVASGPSYQITVNAGMGADGADIGRRIVEEIRKFERFNGVGWRS
jgi:hypothetical protein